MRAAWAADRGPGDSATEAVSGQRPPAEQGRQSYSLEELNVTTRWKEPGGKPTLKASRRDPGSAAPTACESREQPAHPTAATAYGTRALSRATKLVVICHGRQRTINTLLPRFRDQC